MSFGLFSGKLFEHLTARLPAAAAAQGGGGGGRASPHPPPPHQPPTPPHTPRAASPGQAAALEQERRRLLARTAMGGNGVSDREHGETPGQDEVEETELGVHGAIEDILTRGRMTAATWCVYFMVDGRFTKL